jgi:hypothetical protein
MVHSLNAAFSQHLVTAVSNQFTVIESFDRGIASSLSYLGGSDFEAWPTDQLY